MGNEKQINPSSFIHFSVNVLFLSHLRTSYLFRYCQQARPTVVVNSPTISS